LEEIAARRPHSWWAPDRVLPSADAERRLRRLFGGSIEHSLQAATLAYRDRMDEEYVVCALLHDMGDILASTNHASCRHCVEALRLRTRTGGCCSITASSQGYYFFHYLGLDRNMREQFAASHFERTALFCGAA